tara:strand:- start:1223 stop:1918 length:696 start_codon:yes stop_codon:yes gene_type:complete
MQTNPENNNDAAQENDAVEDTAEHYDSFSDNLDSAPQPPQEEVLDKAAKVSSAALNRIDELEKQLAMTKDQMIRAVAETENIRKRSQREKEDARKFALNSFARDLLNVADNLRRALDATTDGDMSDPTYIKNMVTGVEATERELLKIFQQNGIEKLEPIDQPFDPNFHEVMFEAPVTDKPTGTIIQVIEPGYVLNGRILKPARVGVSRNDSPGQTASDGDASPGGTIDTEA